METKKYEKIFDDNDITISIQNEKISICSESHDEINIILIVQKQVKVIEPEVQTFEYHTLLLKNGDSGFEEIILSAEEVICCCDKTLKKRFGCKAVGKNSQLICRILQESCSLAEEVEVYNFNGWGGDVGKRYFIYGNKKITSQGIESIENRIGTAAHHVDISVQEACSFINENYLKILNNQLYAHIFLCYSVAANIHQLIRDIGGSVDFMLYICGETGTGKTSTTFPMLNPFDASNCSIGDSYASVMNIVHQNHCSVTILDDVKSRNNKQCVKILDSLSRIAGDKTTDLKRKCGKKVSSVALHNLIAATAEVEPPLQTSSFPRLLVLNFDRNTVNSENLKQMEINIGEFKEKTVAFILYFVEDCLKDPAWSERVKKEFEQECKILRDSINCKLHGRYYCVLAWLLVIWRNIKEFFSSHGCDVSEANFEKELKEMIVAQHKKYSEKDPAKMYCSALHMLMENGELKCVKDENIKNCTHFDVIVKGGDLQVKTKTVYQRIKRYYEERDIDFFWKETYIRNELDRAGLIRVYSGGKTRTTSERKVNGLSFSFISIYQHKLTEFLEEDNENG